MSWIEKVKNKMVIQTGDGKQFTPEWINAKVVVDYNTAEFNFPGVHGTLVSRSEQKGSKFSLEFYFQGDDHLEQMKDFVRSAQDKRFWTISHPLYDLLTVQPTSLNIDNSKYNVSKIIASVIHTITDVNPKVLVIIKDTVELETEEINQKSAERFANDVTPSSSDKNVMEQTVEAFYFNAAPNIIDDDDGQTFFNKLNDARSKIRNATTDANQAMRAVNTFIQAPALFKQDLETRLGSLVDNFATMKSNILGAYATLADMPNSLKNMFESMASAILTSICLGSVNPEDENDYGSRVQVTKTVELLLNQYNEYLVDLDAMQSGNGGNPNDFMPNSEIINQLNDLVNFTMANLFSLALDAKQERVVVLEDDSNFITLTHRLYGLDVEDNSIDELMRNNNLGLNGILNIKKGTEITYYV
jgi:uncharacterized membrane protein